MKFTIVQIFIVVFLKMASGYSQIIPLQIDEENPNGLYQYKLPPLPKESEIWYYNVPKKSQYWRTPHNTDHRWLDPKGNLKNVKQMDERTRIEYIDYWRDKWENGLWIMINGEPTWLTGLHIDHLVFNSFKGAKFMYVDSQRERMYFRDLTDKELLCDGRLWIKGRRVGITAEQVSHGVRVVNSDSYNNVNCQSDTHTKAKSTLLQKMIEIHTRRPEWMREVFYSSNGKIPRTELELIDSKLHEPDDYPLGGKIRAFTTLVKATDGEEAMLAIMDELSKWPIEVREAFDVNIKTIVNPGKRGKLDALSTTGDSDSVRKAVVAWHQLIADSNPKALNPNGKTNSGLWPFFVSYIHSFELLENLPAIKDIYGKINREMAEEYIWNEVNKYPKDTKGYVFALYKMPMSKRHALLTPAGQGYFSKIKISNRLEYLRGLSYDKKPYVLGSLEYDQHGRVYFESNAERELRCERDGIIYEKGHWMLALHPFFSYDRNIDTRNRYRKGQTSGILYPPTNPEGCIGYDPIRYNKEDTSSTHLSDAAIIVYKEHDYFKSGEAQQFAALYLHRPDDPRDANRECIKAAKYWGYPVMHERVIESVKEDFIAAKMLPFLLKNPKDKLYGLWIDSQGKIVKNALEWMITRFSNPKTEEDIDFIATMPFEPVLVDLDGIDIANTTAYDVFMALVELEHGLKQIPFTNVTDRSIDNSLELMNRIFPPHN